MTPQEVAETALAAARTQGIEIVAIVEELSSANVRWAGNAVTGNGATDDRRLTVIALDAGAGPGVATACGDLAADGVGELVAAAARASDHGVPAEPGQPPLPEGVDDGWRRPPAAPALSGLPGFADRLAGECRSAGAAGHFLYGYAEQRARTTYLASSAGLRRRHEESGALLDHSVRCADGAVTWSGTYHVDLSEVDLDAQYAAARRRLDWWQRRIELPAGDYEVLLSPSCVADLMLRLYAAAGARAALEGRSVFAAAGGTRIGERLSAAPLTLYSDPGEPGLACLPFNVARGGEASVFDNGLPLARTNWITDGVLTALVQSRHTAAATGRPATPEVANVVLRGTGGTADARPVADLVARTERGLLLTSLWYLREVDPASLLLTGLTRDGVYLVEDGRIRGATNNFRFNVSPLAVLDQVREVGHTEPTLPREYGEYPIRTAMPWLRVSGFTMSAVSDAT